MNAITTENTKRNPNLSKWNILFEREGKQWMSIRPQEGVEVYACYACRELFGCKTSFLDHVNRFTIVLTFKCDMCSLSEELQFYNPCALLLHSRQHYTPFGGHVSLDNLKVSCLPFGLVGFPPLHDIPMIYDVNDIDANGVNINTRFYAPSRLNKGKNLISMVPTILLFYHYRINGAPPASLVLKQICNNIPKCVFTKLETATINPNIVSAFNEKRIAHNEGVININNNSVIINSNIEKINSLYRAEINENGIELENNVNSRTSRLESVEDVLDVNVEKNKKKNNENINPKNAENIIEEVEIKEEAPEENSSKENEELAVENPLETNTLETNPLEMTLAVNPLANTSTDAVTTSLNNCTLCPECNAQLLEAKLVPHFSGTIPLNDKFQCEICKYIAASPCSFEAHKRLHVREAPYICPECGKDFKSNIELLDHLEDVCFHLAKQVRLRCPKKNCCKVFAQLSTFMIHFEVHIQTMNKCTVCGATFYAVRDHVEHSEADHSKVVPSDIIYKCTICKNSTLHAEHYSHHVQWHCKDESLRVYVYICKYCRNFFRSVTTYANHLMRCNKKDLTIEEMRRLKKSSAAIVCLHCNYVVRLISKLDDCPRCGRSISGRTVSKPTAKKPKIPEVTHIIPRMIKCILCFKDLIFHEAQLHECKYKDPKVVMIKDDENIRQIIGMKKEEGHESTSRGEYNTRRKRRKASISPTHSKQRRSMGNYGNDPEPCLDKPVPFQGTYECKLCDYKDNDRTSFHEHIKYHRNVSTAYQCMECGDCFVVKPSFHKHLLYYHKIINVDEYVKENQCVDESAISELKKQMKIESGEINDDVEENQCKVCLKQFTDDLELKKHFRIHGMAFLRTNK